MNRIPAVVIVDEIHRRPSVVGQENITASASTSDSSRKRRSVLLLLLLIAGTVAAAVVAPAVVTFPFIKRQMVLGLVEGVLQLGDAPPPVRLFLVRSDDLDRTGRLQESALWLLLLTKMVPVVMVVVPQVLLPDVVLVQIELVFVVVLGGRGNVPLLGVAAVLGADRPR